MKTKKDNKAKDRLTYSSDLGLKVIKQGDKSETKQKSKDKDEKQ